MTDDSKGLPPILVSACLLGQPVRFDGGGKPCHSPLLARWVAEGRVLAVCPEQAGGLPTPRPPAERQPEGGVRTREGRDVSAAFEAGAAAVLALAQAYGVALAIFKEGSPACGVGRIYDGRFQGHRIPGQGLATEALRAAGIPVFSEDQLEAAARALIPQA